VSTASPSQDGSNPGKPSWPWTISSASSRSTRIADSPIRLGTRSRANPSAGVLLSAGPGGSDDTRHPAL
jgi:hypothetical protein